MRLHPFNEVVTNAEAQMNKGAAVYQQWLCAHCGAKQTMSDRDKFYTSGKCEECGKVTDIVRDGCNFMATWGCGDADEFDRWFKDFAGR